MRALILLFTTLSLLNSCIKEAPRQEFAPQFVVEGSIEEGGYAQVKLTHNIPMGYILDKEQLEQLIIRWATVRIYTDTDQEFLTLVRDDELFPYYYYQGRALRGKAGETYKLEVLYNDVVLRSETVIPVYKPQIEGLDFRIVGEDQAIPAIHIDNSEPTANYLLYSRHQGQRHYYTTSPKGFKASEYALGTHRTELLRGYALLDTTEKKSSYYKQNDVVDIKISNISADSQRLWSAYTQQGVQFSFLNYSSNFRGNIEGDAIGIWHGANSATAHIEIK